MSTTTLPTPTSAPDAMLLALDDALNRVIEAHGLVEGVERFYADDVVMQEGTNEPVRGLAANLARERGFASAIATVHELRLLSRAVGDGVTFSEWRFDLTMKDGERVTFDEVAVRRWRDGLVAEERFYIAR